MPSAKFRFPWRLFRRFLWAQLGLILALALGVALMVRGLLRAWFERRAASITGLDASERERLLQEILAYYDGSLPLLLGLIAGLFLLFSAWLGRGILSPLARVLVKAQEAIPDDDAPISKGRGTIDEDVLSGSHPLLEQEGESEWSELESALDQIRSNLRSKTETLGREREELATLMSAISDAILAVDIQGRPLFYNSRFALSFGDRELSEGKRSLSDLFRTPEVLEAYRKSLVLGQQREVLVQLGTRSEPEAPRMFRLSVNPLRREGTVYGAVGIFYDVTELKRAEQIRIDFVANVSHELRTPLTSIKGFADTLKEDLRQGQLADAGAFLEKISRNVDRLMALIGDLLDLSSLDSGAEVQKSLVPTRELTERVLGGVEPLRAAKGHAIEVLYSVEHLQGQSSRIEQVLTNLIENAIKYMPPRGRIRVVWEAHPKGGVLLRVADSGPGIPIEHQARLFERFYRIDKGRSREMGGTGLGLAIVKHILQVHGGSVYVTSEAGKGAEFVCHFPSV